MQVAERRFVRKRDAPPARRILDAFEFDFDGDRNAVLLRMKTGKPKRPGRLNGLP